MLVHRDEQLAQLQRAFAACEKQGNGHVALISGAVGSGKTRLLETFSEWAVTTGGRVLTAAASRAERGLHFGVLGQLLHTARLSREDASQIECLTRDAALSLPVAGTGDEAAVDVATTDGPLWTPLLRGVFTSLLNLADERPLVLAVDDLHHADAASLHCLLYVIRRVRHSRVTVLLSEASTPRAAHPLFHAELRSQPHFARITLPPLSVDSIALLLDEETETGDVWEEAGRLLHMTGGNPLLTRALVDEHANRRTEHTAATGPRVDDVFDQAVLGCLYRHEPGVRRVARAMAVLNRSASAELLGQLLDVLPDSTVPAVRVLRSAGILEADQLRHPRIGHSILSDIPAEERRRLHQRAAEVLHEHGAEPGVVAEHLVASAWTGAPWVVTVLKDAAAQALEAGRPDLATAYLRLGARAGADGEHRTSIIAMLVNARWQVNPLAIGGHLDESVDAARTTGWCSPTALSTVPYLLWQGRAEEAVEVVTGFSPDDHASAGRLQVMQLLVALSHPDHLPLVRETPSSWSRAAAVPHSVSPSLQAVSVLGNALIPTGGSDTVAAAEQLLQRHHTSGGALGLLTAPLLALLCAGRSDRAAAWSEVLLDRPGARHAAAWRGIVRAIRAEAALRLGDLPGAELHARAALQDLPVPAWGAAVGGPLGTLITCATEAGRLFEADRWLAQPVPPGMFRTPAGAHYLAARGRHHLAMGRPQAATSDLHRCGELLRTWGTDVAGLVPWRLELARVQLSLGNRTHAAQLLQEQLHVPHGLDDRTRGRALRLLASTAAPDHRRKLLAAAVPLLQSCGDRQELAQALTDTSQTLQQAGDSAQARMFVRRANQLTQDSGTGPIVPHQRDRWRSGSEVAEPVGDEARDQDSVLSEAERRVAGLAARGHTNRQISNELFITVSTVEQHLTRVYRKLDVKRRTDLPNRLLAHAEPVAEGHVAVRADADRPAGASAR
ncbi:AAA family ATPase [Streptomyces sp. ACA25]|uniref:ATP-binding protein n=1 Tax=Streptomyces sp. ACA25 TaxID=3022596 RepID=UPI002306FE74|nr:LuxR family transcriptional regulator [Streptomyces sp. ACA25]MDB1090144.1 AAA family ATPase [Streptomyces sp. ACA25]